MEAVRLDIGCGERCTPGFAPVDIAQGQAAWPLAAWPLAARRLAD
jgi:hypothetical protein